MVNKFYFSFGTAEQFPFKNTYLIVLARDEKDAISTFRKHYPDANQGYINCSFVYSEKEFKTLAMCNERPACILVSESIAMYKMLLNAIQYHETHGHSSQYISDILKADKYGFDVVKKAFASM